MSLNENWDRLATKIMRKNGEQMGRWERWTFKMFRRKGYQVAIRDLLTYMLVVIVYHQNMLKIKLNMCYCSNQPYIDGVD